MGSELLNQIFEEDISLNGGDSDNKLMEPEEDLNETRPYSIIDELMDGPPNHCTKYQTSTSHPLATMATTTSASTINNTPSTSTSTASHGNMQQKTTAAHIQFTAQPSTTISKPTTTPSNRSSSPSKHIPFNFHFKPSRPIYITDLNLPTKLAKLCRDIQLNAELSIIKLVEDHLKNRPK